MSNTRKVTIIGVCGGSWEAPGIGKTTVASIVAKNFGFFQSSFSDPVRDVATRLFGWDGKMEAHGRVLLDSICRAGREISEHYWRDLAVVRLPPDTTKVVMDDVYFDNEAKFVIENGGLLLRVVRQGFPTPHMPCRTVDISNDGSIMELQRVVTAAVNEFMAGIV